MPDEPTAVEQGYEAMSRGAWAEARAAFKAAIERDLGAVAAYEGLSWCGWALDEVNEVLEARETAIRLYRQAGDNLGAARMAMWLASDYLDFRGDLVIASGWRQRAHRMLEGLPPAPEHAWLTLMEGDVAMLVEDDPPKVIALARESVRLARELGVTDVEIIGLAMEGFALVSQGDLADGMRLLDEAAAAAMSGEMSETGFVSWVLCYVIYACERVRDYDRAMEWCDRMREYAERGQMAVLRGICRVHYAGVLIWRGDWPEAETELAEAATHLEPHHPMLAADGTVRLAELRHRQGRIKESEELFRQVEWHPLALLGLAELALESGRPKDAQEQVARFMRQVPEGSRTQRASGLELLARAEALLGNHARANEALESIRQLSQTVATPPLRAAISYSAGALAVADRDFELAQTCFEDAVDLYDRCRAPYESARARLELASVLVVLGRLERARIEAVAAHDALQTLGSVFFGGRAASLQQDIARRLQEAAPEGAAASALTERQIEVLRLISRGLNDREIAEALVLSEHTVHRHVSNILQRLDLPSRASAVAHASQQGMI